MSIGACRSPRSRHAIGLFASTLLASSLHVILLAHLAPDIVARILAGTQPVDLTARKLIKPIDLPLGWAEQGALPGFAS